VVQNFGVVAAWTGQELQRLFQEFGQDAAELA
jgi:hypothetical protein